MCWVPPGETTWVAGRTLPGGMLYVGEGLRAAVKNVVEPALLDPGLPVAWGSPDWFGRDLDYWPSYAELTPESRAAYLRWLEAGRRHRDVSVGYAFLFFYGLERRVLVDLERDQAARAAEVPVIRAEVARLRELFGSDRSFNGYATEFLELLDAVELQDTRPFTLPAPPVEGGHPSVRLRMGLGRMAREARPVPADWALAWVLSHPTYAARTVVSRCPDEFARLFALRFDDRHPDGFRLQPTEPDLTFVYRPASSGFQGLFRMACAGTPDVFDQPLPLRRLKGLAEECAEALDPFSRLVGRDPGLRHSLAGTALLPPELIDLESGPAATFVDWARSRLGGFPMSTVPVADWLAWVEEERPTKKSVIALAQILEHAGIGLEPDPRFGGPVPQAGSILLFHAEERLEATPSQAYQAAMLLMHLGGAVSAADGHVAVEEKQLLTSHLEQALGLTAGERRRLRAHLRWLLTTEIKLSGLSRRVQGMDHGQREHVADFLAAVAAADGRIDPAEAAALRRIAKLLELAPGEMDRRLQAATAGAAPAAEPVVVRPGRPDPGHAVPPPPPEQPRADGTAALTLDPAVLAARVAEAAEVAALLGSVFADEEPAATPAAKQATPAAVDDKPVTGLDMPHSRLVHELAAQEQLPRSAWEDLAAAHRVLPDGALDRINEAAFEVAGEPAVEGEDPLEINHDALGAML
ncbi:TerB N-terminal domain-containing protein [Spirillospora sp. NPDC029432]|uniref:tellurite resistance TerB family protein n=1 Tax=Spirillospora sp. NPDC029432 TaxID=3154599 RepID=UPI003455E49D